MTRIRASIGALATTAVLAMIIGGPMIAHALTTMPLLKLSSI